MGMTPFRVADADRVALSRGRVHREQPPRRAARAGRGVHRRSRSRRSSRWCGPPLDNVAALGTRAALTGPGRAWRRRDGAGAPRRRSRPPSATRTVAMARRTAVLGGRDRRARGGAGVKVVETIAERAGRDRRGPRRPAARSGCVPTMGFFHAGHRSLMTTAAAAHDLVVVSSFVNPTQFAPNEDLAAYPRDPDGDDAVAAAAGVDVMFRPDGRRDVPRRTAADDGARRRAHRGHVRRGAPDALRRRHHRRRQAVLDRRPAHAYFGRKDFQQLAVVRRMTRDLDLPVTVVGCPLVREADGLAMSSRNAYLTPEERAAAPALHAALVAVADAVRDGDARRRRGRGRSSAARVAAEPLLDARVRGDP